MGFINYDNEIEKINNFTTFLSGEKYDICDDNIKSLFTLFKNLNINH